MMVAMVHGAWVSVSSGTGSPGYSPGQRAVTIVVVLCVIPHCLARLS